MAYTAVAWFFGIAGVTVLTIGVIAYAIHKSKSNNKKHKYYEQNLTRTHDGVIYQYDPDSKTIVESSAPVSNDSNNNLRKRTPTVTRTSDKKNDHNTSSSEKKSNLRETKEEKSNLTETKEEKKSNLTETKEEKTSNLKETREIEVQTEAIENNLGIMTVDEKISDFFRRNINPTNPEEASENSDSENAKTSVGSSSSSWTGNLSSVKSTDSSQRAYKKKVHKAFKKFIDNYRMENELPSENSSEHYSESDTSTSDNLSCTSTSTIFSGKSSDEFKKSYKKKIEKSIKKFQKNIDQRETARAPSECSNQSSSSFGSFELISAEDLECCYACKENPINAYAQPCNHRYMCSDCAKRVLNLYNRPKCKVCRVKIESIVEDNDSTESHPV